MSRAPQKRVEAPREMIDAANELDKFIAKHREEFEEHKAGMWFASTKGPIEKAGLEEHLNNKFAYILKEHARLKANLEHWRKKWEKERQRVNQKSPLELTDMDMQMLPEAAKDFDKWLMKKRSRKN